MKQFKISAHGFTDDTLKILIRKSTLSSGFLTPFEQAAYNLQHTPKNRVSGSNLGEPLPINETTIDKQYLLIAVCLTLFVIMLILA